MLSKYIVPALCASVSIQGVAAVSHHRHQHLHQKKDVEYAHTDLVVVTEVVTKTVTEGEEEPTPTPSAKAVWAGKRPSRRPSKRPSTTVEVTTTPAAPVEEPTTYVPEPTTSVKVEEPVVTSTTLATSVAAPSADKIVAAFTEAAVSVVSSVAAAATSAVSSGSGGKRGIAYNDASLASSVIAGAGGVFSWAYNWGATDGGLSGNVKYVPTCWSPGKSQGWSDNAAKAIAKGSDVLFSFNECDIASQANMSPADAAAGHISLMNPFKGQARIGAPAISSSQNANQGIDWLTQFFAACGGSCVIDFCNVHWYGSGGEAGAEEFLTHLVNVNKACQGKNIWVTEFKAEDSAENEAAFIKHAISELETNSKYSFVEKYAYFYLSNGYLATGNTLNTLGQLYAAST